MKWAKVLLVIVCAVVVTALGIDAADTLTGARGTLLSQVIESGGGCPSGMSPVPNIAGLTCVDTYEVSTSEACDMREPRSVIDSIANLENPECWAESKKDALPWTYVTRDQAMQMCARAGKRLPKSEEWYAVSLGMANVEKTCNIRSGKLMTTGKSPDCVSPAGAHDMVGNVWEWVSDDVIDGAYGERALPESGYVAQVDQGGMATLSTSTEQELFEKDYFWSNADGAFGIIRGGYYDSGTDAGLYTVHADTPPTTAGGAIGFRCVI